MCSGRSYVTIYTFDLSAISDIILMLKGSAIQRFLQSGPYSAHTFIQSIIFETIFNG